MVDQYSKWVEAIILPDSRACSVWSAFETQLIFRYGAPVLVINDNGTEFLGEFQE